MPGNTYPYLKKVNSGILYLFLTTGLIKLNSYNVCTIYSDKAKNYKDVTFYKHMRCSLIQIHDKKKNVGRYINFPNIAVIFMYFNFFWYLLQDNYAKNNFFITGFVFLVNFRKTRLLL